MQRPIKFRAWSYARKEMTDWTVLRKLHVSTALWPYPGSIELMQYTGLKDKQNVEIYEGDLLRKEIDQGWDEHNFVAYEVFYHDNDAADKHIGFQMNRTHFQGSIAGTSEFPQLLPRNTKKMIIIGNIYSNPELLTNLLETGIGEDTDG